jgi:GTP-binding protein EngB required for normal cell division
MSEHGLDRDKIERLKDFEKESDVVEFSTNDLIKNPEINNFSSKSNIDGLSLLDIEDKFYSGEIENYGYEKHILNAIKHYFVERKEAEPKRIEDLPPLAPNRTDLYFIGLSRAGKSTILSSLLYTASRKGKWSTDVDVHPEGIPLNNMLLHDFANNVIPQATVSGSFNYIAATFKDQQRQEHPFNIIEMPGEIWEKIGDQRLDLLDDRLKDNLFQYLKSDNRKIIMFVLDIDQRDYAAYSEQFTSYGTFLSLFRSWGILNNTEAIYFIVNKIDLKDNSFSYDLSKDLAKEILESEFINLLENAQDFRKIVKNNYKVKAFPFSVGKLMFEKIIDKHEIKFSEILLDNLIEDSFHEKESWWKKYL